MADNRVEIFEFAQQIGGKFEVFIKHAAKVLGMPSDPAKAIVPARVINRSKPRIELGQYKKYDPKQPLRKGYLKINHKGATVIFTLDFYWSGTRGAGWYFSKIVFSGPKSSAEIGQVFFELAQNNGIEFFFKPLSSKK